ncbi:general stress protein [Staphylococcus equorum]|uniref:general stress protein n=1 Tax=Staphylococcus equorum TaxID=246432 RepID=UPI002DBB777E|nr:general stress protein [Staphylococcus equorum]MEB7672627.1 general stress protein [Staphylococcus equorum]
MKYWKGMIRMPPVVKPYTNDSALVADVKALKDRGIGSQDIYVLSNDKNRTAEVTEQIKVTAVDYNEVDIDEDFDSKSEELKEKLSILGVPSSDAETCDADMKEDKIILIVTDFRVKGLL